MLILHFINWILNLPVGLIEAHNPGDLLTLVLLLSWLYIVSVAVLFAILLGTWVVRGLPLFVAVLLCKLMRSADPLKSVFLELAFPASTTKSAYATEQLHVLLQGQASYHSFLDRLAGRKQRYSLEKVGTRSGGIRYILVVPENEIERISRSLLSYLPGVKIKQVPDYLKASSGASVGVTELCLGSQFVLPLQEHKALEEHDPEAYLTGQMTKLAPNELIALQMVVSPVRRSTHFRVLQRVHSIQSMVGNGEALLPELNKRLPRNLGVCLLLPIWIAQFILKFAFGMIAALLHLDDPVSLKIGSSNKRQPDDPYEQELAGFVKAKLDQDLFEVSMRILIASDSEETIASRTSALVSAYRTFASPYQSIVTKRFWPLFREQQANRLLARFRKRALSSTSLSYGSIVSSSELSDLYHSPNTELTKTEGLVKSRSPDLPAPLSLKSDTAQFDVIVGVNEFGGEESPIGLTLKQRQKHMYVIGKTGTGKTTLLKSAIYQDMMSGKGLAVLDPHGDMFRELLALVPKHRYEDVIVFDPSDRGFPIGLNVLDPGIEFVDEDDQREWVTSAVLSIFERLADEKQWGPRMEHILRNTTMTVLHIPNASLYTLQRLLTDKKYQREVAKTLKDPVLKQFWDKEFKLLGSMQMSAVIAPLTHRLGHFITTKMSRHILLQEKSTLRIADIMNEGKILLVNLSKGDTGEDQSFFFGTILTAFMWMAAYQRTKIREKDRRDFFLYVDEFQNFATKQFTDITSEGRKFHISLIASHQNVAQIRDKSILKIVAGNSHTMVCLKASPEDEAFILPYMEPAVEKGDIVNLTPYRFFMKTTANESEDAFSGVTVPLGEKGSDEVRDLVVAYSRKRYGTLKAEVEKRMEELFGQQESKKRHTQRSGDKGMVGDKVHGA